MADDPFTIIHVDDAEAIFYLGSDDNAKTVNNVDVEVVMADGTRWSATMLTLAEISRIMERRQQTGETFGGRYFQCQDLVIIRDAGLPAMVNVVRHLVRTGDLRYRFVRLEDDAADQ